MKAINSKYINRPLHEQIHRQGPQIFHLHCYPSLQASYYTNTRVEYFELSKNWYYRAKVFYPYLVREVT